MRSDEPSTTALGVALIRSTLDRPSTPTGDPAADDALTRSLLGDGAHPKNTGTDIKADRGGFGRFMALRWIGEAGWTIESADDVLDEQDTPTGRLLVLAHPSPTA